MGTNAGDGHDLNPVTGEPYAPNRVVRADFARALAEFWADGPNSETPPGHWNTIANTVSDMPGFEHRLGGTGPELDRLEWDVKMYLALNGAVHDAAVAAWGLKSHYDSVRPISMIRYMGGLGQSSDPAGPSYHASGLPLVPGLVEVVTAATSAPGQRHAHLADHIGEVVVRSWRGNPDDPATEVGGVDWIRAVEWVPYQMSTFVTPAFAGYVSGHSTFSRAAAEVMTAITGDEYFPGGLSEWTVARGGPHVRVRPERRRDPSVGDVLRRRRPGRPVARSSAASTSAPTTSRVAASARRAAERRGRWPRRISRDPRPRPPDFLPYGTCALDRGTPAMGPVFVSWQSCRIGCGGLVNLVAKRRFAG